MKTGGSKTMEDGIIILFRENVFSEDRNETLTLRVKLRIQNQDFNIGDSFRKGRKIGGVNFHTLKNFDLAVKVLPNDVFNVLGFLPQE